MKNYIPIIGLEVHIELKTESKMFCGCSSDHFAKKPNSQTCPVCLGLPGALPCANARAIEYTLMMGKALNCKINRFSKFDRKHYFYPDLPKSFQTSQYDLPFCKEGYWESRNKDRIRIRRIHLEEDTAKLVHERLNGKPSTLIDFNRSGVPLMELVTEPDFHTPDLVNEFLKNIQMIVRYLGISDAQMRKGSMRLEANISLSEEIYGTFDLPEYKIELKNINSFKFLVDAISFEINRLSGLTKKSIKIKQETRGYDEKTKTTFSQRGKEEAMDYRYFPEPDLPPFSFERKFLKQIDKNIPVLPDVLRKEFEKKYNIPDSFIEFIVADKKRYEYFEKSVNLSIGRNIGTKAIADMIVNKKAMEIFPEPQLLLGYLLKLTKKDSSSSEDTEKAIDKAISSYGKAVAEYKKGKTQVLGFLIGMVQKELNGKGEIKLINDLLLKKLN